MIRLVLAAGIAVIVSLLGTIGLAKWLVARKIGQPIHEDVPEGHTVKAGTPTMGGVAIVAGALAGYVISDWWDKKAGVFTWTGLACMGAIVGAGLVGFVDDWLKVSRERNLGLNKTAKMVGLLASRAGVRDRDGHEDQRPHDDQLHPLGRRRLDPRPVGVGGVGGAADRRRVERRQPHRWA